jgi:hypothetical protein
MCEIIGIDESIPSANEKDSGGAQYIMKNVDATFWEKVEADSESLYQFFLHHIKAFPQSNTYHPIQMWTSDMWAVLWNAWYFKYETKVVPEMNFAWPGQPSSYWENSNIFHNAGVVGVSATEGLFYKGMYINKLPYNDDFSWVKQNKCSYKYLQEILETAKESCLI